MENSIILARFLGIFFTIWGLGVIANQKRLHGTIDEIVKSQGLQLIAALLPLIIGSFFVAVHNVWTKDWQVIITIFGYLFLFAGAFRAIMTQTWVNLVSNMKGKVKLGLVGVIVVALGLMFLYFGYVKPTVESI